MKIGPKIIVGFVFVSLLVGIVGFLGIYANKLVVSSFETGEEHFGAIIEASNEVSSYAKRAEGHAMLYLTLKNGSDKKKFFQRIGSLREQISIIENNVTNPHAKKIATTMKIKTDEFQTTGELLFKEHDVELNSSGKFEFENHETSIRRLDDIGAEIRQEGLTLAKFEIELQQAMNKDAKTQADFIQNIVFLISLIAVIGSLILGYGISKNIANPVMKLRDAVENIGKGNLGARIEISSKDEIGELASSFNRMGSDLWKLDKERLDVEENLKKSLKNWEDTFKAISDGVWILDMEGHVINSNGVFERLLGKATKDILNHYCYSIAHHSSDFIDECPFKKMRKTGQREVAELNDKEHGVWLQVVVDPIFDESGKVVRAVHVVHDITEARKSEDLRVEKERVEYANMAKSEFLATMSHELRTPLNSIIGFSELLKEGMYGGLNEKQEHYMNNVLTSSKFLLDLINDILDLSKVEAGKIEIVMEKISVPVTIGETLILIKEKASSHNVLIKQEIDPQISVIEVDKQRFKQILFNLLSNAVKFSKKEGGTVTITAKKEGDMAKFSVSDTGIGIKEEDMGKLFRDFSQASPEISNKYGGTGLGLSITKKLVELHGGRITAESKYGQGSTFTFTLPVEKNKTA